MFGIDADVARIVSIALALVAAYALTRFMASTSIKAERRAEEERQKLERYRAQRQRALERREEELRAASFERENGKDTTDRETALEKKLAELDAKAARLGVLATRGRQLGSSSTRSEWNPLTGSGSSSGYRPQRRAPPGGG